MHAKSIQLCLTLCNPVAHSPPGFSVHGILQGENARVGCHALLREISIQGSNLLHWQAGSLPLAHLECPQRRIPKHKHISPKDMGKSKFPEL